MIKTFIIGRNPNVSQGEIPISINDPAKKVSSNHCRITYDGVNFYIEDLISTNGTFVDGVRINSKTRITDTNKISLGDSYQFSLSHSTIQNEIYKNSNSAAVNTAFSSENVNGTNNSNLEVGYILKEGFNLGMKNFGSIAVSYFLWILTIWVPYINVGTTIAIATLPLGLASNKIMSPVEIFDSKYRRQFGEFFLLIGLMLLAFIISINFMVIPGFILFLCWSQAPLILIDRKLNLTECLTVSNRITYGNKFSMFWINLLMVFILMFGYLFFIGLGALGIMDNTIAILIIASFITFIYVLFWLAFSLGVKAMIYKELSKNI